MGYSDQVQPALGEDYSLASPEVLLERAMAKCEDLDQFKFMHGTFRALREASVNLARYFCDVVPTREELGAEPLLDLCVREAWTDYRTSDRAGGTMNDRAEAYMRGLLRHAGQVNDCRIYVRIDRQYVTWRFGSEPLHEFLARHPGHRPHIARERYAAVDESSTRIAVATRILDLYYVGGFRGTYQGLTQQDAPAPAVTAKATP